MKKKKILISGAGVAGLMTAIKLDHDKYEIEIVEQSDGFNSQGYGVVLWKSGIDILQDTFEDSCDDWLHRIDTIDVVCGNKFNLVRSIKFGEYTRSVKRADLIDRLSSLYKSQFPNDKVTFNTTIDKYSKGKALFSDGRKGDYDLVIAADGANSKLRDKYIDAQVKKYDYSVKYLWADISGDFKDYAIPFATNSHAGIIYTLGPETLIGYYNVSDSILDDDFEASLAEYLKERFGGEVEFKGSSAHYFDNTIVEVETPYKDKLVLVGDAYHCQTPTVAFGTSIALEDAVELAARLNEEENIENALKTYANNRKDRIKEVYRHQELAERLSITSNPVKLYLSYLFSKLFIGAWYERKMRKLVSYSRANHR